MDFAILGPLEVRRDGETIAFGGPKTRGLLALFLVSANEWVSTDRLIEDLWAGEPPARAGSVLQVHVANLRKALEPTRTRGEASRLATRPGGYLLSVAPEELDSLMFESLVTQGRAALANDDPSEARVLLGSALALWRGAVLGDLGDEPFVTVVRARFEEERAGAFEDHAEAGLRLGHHSELVADLEAAVHEHPLRERLWGQLMLALYRAGRQAEALRTYGNARTVLVDELGIDPGPELQALERAILEQDPDLAAPARASAATERVVRRARSVLPQPQNRLVGRDVDVATVAALLEESGVRMVTLTGAGGAGKTRLAEAVAHALVDRFRDGVVLVRLGSIAGPDFVASAIAEALGVDEVAGQPVSETLARALGDLELLLVIDNFEHLLAASGVLADLLGAAAALKLIVTSRSSLRLSAEYEFEVPPLAVPPSSAGSTFALLSASPAVELFCERARAARSGFTLTEAQAPTVAEICIRLDGLPLAIELAAARVRVLTPDALLARLGHRLDLLTGGARDAPDRQRTLRATIEWSFDLLGEAERRLFAWLGGFGGWFGLADVEAVCGEVAADAPEADAPVELFDLLASLIEKSLVRKGTGADDGRFALFQTVREFATEQLAASADRLEVARRHRERFLALARDAHSAVNTADEDAAFAALDVATDDLRIALTSALEADPATFEQLCTALAPWWIRPTNRGIGNAKLTEASRWMNIALERDDIEPSGELVMHAGVLASRQDDFARAAPLIERARQAFAAANDAIRLADCVTHLGEIAVLQGRLDDAAEWARQAFDLAQQAGDGASAQFASYLLGWIAEENGDLEEARRRFEDDLAYGREHDVPGAIAYGLVTLAELDILEEDLDGAQARVAEARAVRPGSGNVQFESYCHRIEGFVALGRGDGDRAWISYSAALDAATELGRTLESSWCLGGLASAAELRGDHARSARLFAAAGQLRDQAGAAEPRMERVRYEPHLTAVERALGSKGFAATTSAVRVRNVDDARRLISESADPTG